MEWQLQPFCIENLRSCFYLIPFLNVGNWDETRAWNPCYPDYLSVYKPSTEGLSLRTSMLITLPRYGLIKSLWLKRHNQKDVLWMYVAGKVSHAWHTSYFIWLLPQLVVVILSILPVSQFNDICGWWEYGTVSLHTIVKSHDYYVVVKDVFSIAYGCRPCHGSFNMSSLKYISMGALSPSRKPP